MTSNNGYKSDRVPRKTLRIFTDFEFPNMYIIRFKEKGQVPEVLKGKYNSKKVAQKAIDDWMIGYTRSKIYPKAPKDDIPQKLKQKPKVESNGEEESIG